MIYLSIRNWERFQHYKDRRPPWVKFYVELLDDVDFRQLPIGTRLLWDQFLLLAARHENLLPGDPEELSFLTRIPLKDVELGIAQLLAGRWIKQRHASSPASKARLIRASKAASKNASPHARPRARGETETETETETEKEKSVTTPPPLSVVNYAAPDPAQIEHDSWAGDLTPIGDSVVEALERLEFGR